METDENESMTSKQLCGRKKRKFYSKVKAQMEFYFSDSNLSKDKFLSSLIEQDSEGYVDLEIFKSFNKIKNLTTDVGIISAAISKSDFLKVSEDNTKVKRVIPIAAPKDYDACTVYVEKLPPYADRKWIKDVFEHFGVVDHINIPRFKISNKIKGFAFVEFSKLESVMKACEYYRSLNAKLVAESEEENLDSKHGDTRKAEDDGERNSKKRKVSLDASIEKVCENILTKSASKDNKKSETDIDYEKQQQLSHCSKKRKRESCEEEKLVKKLKNSKDVNSDLEEISKVDQEELEKKSVKDNSSAVEADLNSDDEAPGKNKRKRKHKKKNHSQAERPLLRVMSKQEWKTYRNKYLTLQRSTMSLLKKQIMLETQEWRDEHDINAKAESPKKVIQFQSGIIIKVKLKDPITNATDTKDQVKANAVAAYIDAPLGHSEMFIRCHTQDDAQSIIHEGKLQNLGCVELLQGTEEEDYWKKIENDRKIRYSMPAFKKRGRDKIIAKATKLSEQKNKHIYFDE